LIENICSSDLGMKTISQLDHLYFGGAPLSPEIGEMLRGKVKLNSVIGSTEMGILLSMRPVDEADWSYFEWAPNFNIHMDPVSDNLYELVFRRGDNREVNGIFHSFPSLREYRSKDLYIRHPTKKHLWQYSSRSDDIIVLSNGEKFNPVDMEKIIEAHPLVSRALIVGQGRFHSALLIEPNWELWHSRNFPSDSAFLDEIWPKIREANAGAPAYGRIMRSKIGLAAENRPFKTTPKGTTQRRLVHHDYEDLIEALYRNDHKKELECPDEGSLANILTFIRQAVHNQLDNRNVHDADDLYSAGFDSLQTVFLANALSSAITSKHPDWNLSINIQDVYTHPTITSLSQYVTDGLQGNKTDTEAVRYERINHMIQKYGDSLRSERPFTMSRKRGNSHVVLLTGSTGSLGSYILNQLLSDHMVAKIYCLNRSAHAESRQRQLHEERGLSLWQTGGERVEFVKAVFGDDKLGLSESKYNTLLATVDITIHNAWKLDFNQRVESFESLIKSVRDLLAFSLRSEWCSHLFFVSSISTIYGWDPAMGCLSAPEDLIEDPDVVLKQGYAESKHIAERLCYEASKTTGVPTTILRVGQIGGPTRAEGIWNRNEWFPSLIATSERIGKIPASLGANELDWIPVVCLEFSS
jgi:nucleoside-diphosphate-sugar epimerase/aryl carrier-like protein